MGFDYARKWLIVQAVFVFVVLFLAHNRGIVVSDSLRQYRNSNKVAKVDFRS